MPKNVFDLTIWEAQTHQPWTVPYLQALQEAADNKSIPHALASHAVLHAAKSVGKLAAEMEKADHGLLIDEDVVRAMSADLFTIALRFANLYSFNLAVELVQRVHEKNGVNILEGETHGEG